MDIGSGRGGVAGRLSNFTPRRFTFDGVDCCSLEGALQSFKQRNPEVQKHICSLVGREAKFAGKKINWRRNQELFWKGVKYDRHGDEYQDLLDRLYKAAFDQDSNFRRDLKATGKAVLTHSIGKSNPSETILTEREFCSRLTKLRASLIWTDKKCCQNACKFKMDGLYPCLNCKQKEEEE